MNIVLLSQPKLSMLSTGMKAVLERAHTCTFLAASPDSEEMVPLVMAFRPEVSILDATSFHILTLFERLGQKGTALLGPTIVLTAAPPTEEEFFLLMKWGCFALLGSQVSCEDFVDAVLRVGQGECLLTSDILTPSASLPRHRERVTAFVREPRSFNPLSPREEEVLLLVAKGQTNKEIARQLTVSVQTVKQHITSINKRLRCRNRTEAVTLALRQQWIWLPDFPHKRSTSAVA